jgi:hypothetical protein
LQLVEHDRGVRSGKKLGSIIQDRDPAGIDVIISHRYREQGDAGEIAKLE